MVPIFVPGTPGLPELIVLLFIAVIRIGVPLLIVVAIFHYLDGKRGYERRIEELERRIAELEDGQA